MAFDLIDIILVVGIIQGVFLTVTLQRISNNNHKANLILSLLIAIVTIMLIGRLVFFRFFSYWVFQWSILVDTMLFLFGPFLYVYVRRLLFKKDQEFFLTKIHFLPTVIFVLISCYYLTFYNPEEYYELYVEGKLDLFWSSVAICIKVLNALYLVASFNLIRRFKKNEKLVFSFNQSPIKYLNIFLIAVGLCILAWALSAVNSKFFDMYFTYVNYSTVWIAIAIFIYVIGYYSLKQPELFRMRLKPSVKRQKDRLAELESQLLSEKLDNLMLNEKLFLQSNLTLKEVADTLETSTNNISWLLNNVYKSTFYDYINGYRIKEFIQKIENKEDIHQTILALSMDVGFNSKSTFNKAFKLKMNDTPSNFIKKHRAA